jgi:peptide/nickel transport system permease protein
VSATQAVGGRRAPRLLLVGGGAILAWILIALLAPAIAPHDPIEQDLTRTLLPPSVDFPLGTDNYGRDVLSRLIWGTRLDLQMGLVAVAITFSIGTVLGAISGYFGGIVDTLLMRLLDVTISFPFFVLMIAIISVLGSGLGSFYVAVALVGWVSYARVVRAQALVLKNVDYVVAARALGFGAPRILIRHVLPNAIAPAVVFSMSDAVLYVLLGSSLSYLGLGVQPPTPEWGVMIAEGQTYIATAWWITTFPGLAIVLLALCFSLFADGLAEALGTRR